VWLVLLAVALGLTIGFTGGFTSGSRHAGARLIPKTATGTRPDPSADVQSSAVPQGMHLAFDAGFAGSDLDRAVWDTCYPWEDSRSGCTNFGNPQEVEWYLGSQDEVYGGALHLTAVHVPTEGTTRAGAAQIYRYRSGMVTTYSSFDFTYGYVKVVARIPAGPDLWPALWLLPVSQSPLPEVDILEGSPNPRSSLIALHPTDAAPWASAIQTADLSSGWHTFVLDWEPGSLSWSVDGKTFFTTATDIPDVPMYFIADLAVTNYAPACLTTSVQPSCTGSMAIRSVQVWQR
jgi:beta-glucanase (GH16 family)